MVTAAVRVVANALNEEFDAKSDRRAKRRAKRPSYKQAKRTTNNRHRINKGLQNFVTIHLVVLNQRKSFQTKSKPVTNNSAKGSSTWATDHKTNGRCQNRQRLYKHIKYRRITYRISLRKLYRFKNTPKSKTNGHADERAKRPAVDEPDNATANSEQCTTNQRRQFAFAYYAVMVEDKATHGKADCNAHKRAYNRARNAADKKPNASAN